MNFYLLTVIKTGVVAFALLTTLAYLQWAERKVIAHIQLRMGPYRVGPHGLLQPLADVIKLVTKEGLLPSYANRFFYLLAPFLAVALALTSFAVIPFGPEVEIFGVRTYLQLTDLSIGLLFPLAISSLGVYGIALGGWASNNKYSLLGALRSSAQMVSYELPMAMALAAPLLLANTLSLRELVAVQEGFYFGIIPKWHLFQMPFPQVFAFLIFLIAGFAETNRLPFDLPEAENELVAGFHTEYSSLKFAAFFLAEYANMVTVTCITVVLFLGGWHPLFPSSWGSDWVPTILFVAAGLITIYHWIHAPRRRDRYTYPLFIVAFFALAALFALPPAQPILVPLFWFAAKVGFLLFLFMWIRGTLPRFRYDQLMGFAWKFLLPVSIANLLITALLVAVVKS